MCRFLKSKTVLYFNKMILRVFFSGLSIFVSGVAGFVVGSVFLSPFRQRAGRFSGLSGNDIMCGAVTSIVATATTGVVATILVLKTK